MPPTIQALLAARLDRLDGDERAVIERAAVEGKTFHQGSVRALAEGGVRERVGVCLHSLVRKVLVRPSGSSFAGEDAFRFRHVLTREAAYESIPKQLRAQLHDRFAAWLEEVAGDRVGEYEELLGYHLEQAFRYRVELSRVDEWAQSVALRGGSRLTAAGRRALARGDAPAAVNLLRRASALLEEGGAMRTDVVVDLGIALRERGELLGAEVVLSGAIEDAERVGDQLLAERAKVELMALRMYVEPDYDLGDALTLARRAAETFERAGDDAGLARTLRLVADVHWFHCRLAEMEYVLEQALAHAERASDQREVSEILGGLCRAACIGPTPARQCIERFQSTIERATDNLRLQATVQDVLSVLLAAQGEFDKAREMSARARHLFEELGIGLLLAGSMYAALIELLAGELPAAEQLLRRACDELESIGEGSVLSTTAGLLAQVLCEQGRLDEADRYVEVSASAALRDDVASQVLWRSARARIVASRGENDEAESLAREAVRLAAETDWLELHANALVHLSEVLRALGRPGSEDCLREAITLYEKKGYAVSAARAKEQLAALVGA